MAQLTETYDHVRPGYRPTLASGVLVKSIGREAIAWGPGAHRPAYFDDVAALILNVFDGEATTEDIADDLVEVFEIERELAEAHVRRVINLAVEGQLLERTDEDREPWRLMRTLLPEPNW